MQLIQVFSLSLFGLASAGFLQDPILGGVDDLAESMTKPNITCEPKTKQSIEPFEKSSGREGRQAECTARCKNDDDKAEWCKFAKYDAATKACWYFDCVPEEERSGGISSGPIQSMPEAKANCTPKTEQSMKKFEKGKGREARQGDCTWRCENEGNKKAWCKFSKYDASAKMCYYFACVPEDFASGVTSAVLVAARNLTSAAAQAKLDMNQKVYIENAPVLGDGAGQGSLNVCRGFTKSHVSNPDAPTVKVCGTGIKLTAYLRGECQEYYQYSKIVGKCDTKMPSDTCDSYSPADDARFGAYQSYMIEPC